MREKFPLVMGIININTNSFYSKSRETDPQLICSKALTFLGDAASILDLGACSTRPGCTPISCREEMKLLREPLKALKDTLLKQGYIKSGKAPLRNLISIDTFRSEVVEMAYEILGEFTVNDISAGEADPKMLSTVGRLGLPYIAMYNTISTELTGTTPEKPVDQKEDITAQTIAFFKKFEKKAQKAGIKEWILDPGFGFGKTLQQNYILLKNLESLKQFGVPVLVGISRKSMIYKLLEITPETSLEATTALNLYALTKGADILRVHDVAPAVQCVKMYKMLNK